MILIGLTGILGSGKSTVAALLGKRGLNVIDLDALARDSLNWKETQRDIRDAFGDECVVDDKVDVEKLRKMVFAKDDLRRRLEGIIHPRVEEEAQRRLADLKKEGVRAAVIDHPLLFEVGFRAKIDKIVVVTAEMGTIRERLGKRGMKTDDVEARLAVQIPLKEKERRADYVVDNSGTEDGLDGQIDTLVEKITKWEVDTICI